MESFSLKCPSCNANIHYDAESSNWKCEYCGKEYSIDEVKTFEQNANEKIESKKVEKKSNNNSEMNIYTCSNCGAQLVTDENTSATFCVYCGSSTLVKDRLSGEFKPDFIVPFSTSKEQAEEAFRKFINKRRFVPNNFKDEKNIEKMSGVYIPFWTYDNTQRLIKNGTGTNITSWTSGDYTYTKEDVYNYERDVEIFYDDVPVDGSKKFDDDLMDSIEPFDYKKKVEYDSRYLSGFLAEKYDVDKEEAYGRAKLRMDNSSNKIVNDTISFTRRKEQNSSTEEKRGEINYWLLPVWMLNTKFRDKQYQFAMNGDSGKVVGNLPTSIPKLLLTALIVLIPSLVFAYSVNSLWMWLYSNYGVGKAVISFFAMSIISLIAGGILTGCCKSQKEKPKKTKSIITTIIVSLIIALIFLFVIIHTESDASTQTFERTDENYGITKDFNISNSVKNAAIGTPLVDSSEKVYDFADLLTDSEEKLIYNAIIEYIEKYNIDMAVVTINKNTKNSAMEYADDFYDYNGFGIDSVYSGILFLIDMDTREMWISTTGNAILMYDDYRIDRILDDAYEYITEDYYRCVNAFIKKADSYAGEGIPSSNANYYIDENGNYVRKGSTPQDAIPFIRCFIYSRSIHNYKFIIIFASITDLIIMLVLYSKNKTVKKATQANEYVKNIKWNKKSDILVHTHTSKRYNPPSSSSGGSSTHSSSSGSSHGGGGRSF